MPHPRISLTWRVAALLVVAIVRAAPCSAFTLLVRWTVPPEPDVAGYYLYVGRASRDYLERIQLASIDGSTLNGIVYQVLPGLQLATDYYLAVTAYNRGGVESPFSNEKHVVFSSDAVPLADAGPDVVGIPGEVLVVGTAALPGVSYFWSQTAGVGAMLWGRSSGRMELQGPQADTLEFTVTAYTAQGLAARDSVVVVLADPTVPVPTPTLAPSQRPSATVSTTPTSTPTPTASSSVERSDVGRIAAIRQHPNCRVTSTTASSSRHCPD